MFADAVAKLTASIFPIFYAYQHEDGPIISISGTGFCVDDSGLFVTVNHSMNCAPAGSTYYYYGNLPDQLIQPAVEIERVASDPGRDLYLGRVGRGSLRAVDLSGDAVRPGYFVGHPCFSGMSGGPVFDVAGQVRGMAVATVTRTMPELTGEPTVVKNGI